MNVGVYKAIIESDSLCAIKWASYAPYPPWQIIDWVDQMQLLAILTCKGGEFFIVN